MRNISVKRAIFVSNRELCVIFVSFSTLLICSLPEIETIKIVSVSVPNRVNITSTDPVKLDCFFELNSSSENNLRDRELVVQWMFNTSTLLYQWTNNGPIFLNPLFKNYINSSYKIAPNAKPTNMPLIFNARSNNMTGEYMCKVTTALNDDWKAAFLQTFNPAKNIDLQIPSIEEDNKNITCEADGLYPYPDILLTIDGSPKRSNIEIEKKDDGYGIRATYNITTDELKRAKIVNCTIKLTGADFSQFKAHIMSGYAKYEYENFYNDPMVTEPLADTGWKRDCSNVIILFMVSVTLLLNL